MDFPPKLLDLPIAALEEYGLSVRVINIIEEKFGALYLEDMVGITRCEFLDVEGVGVVILKQFLLSIQLASKALQKESGEK